jgi:hypothetical protein
MRAAADRIFAGEFFTSSVCANAAWYYRRRLRRKRARDVIAEASIDGAPWIGGALPAAYTARMVAARRSHAFSRFARRPRRDAKARA